MKYHGFDITKQPDGKYQVRDTTLAHLYPNGIYNIEQVPYDSVKDAKQAIDGMQNELAAILDKI